MSYCRLGRDSDVYAYESPEGFVCCWCRLTAGAIDAQYFEDAKSLLEHLKVHANAGHKVPQDALDELEAEAVKVPASRGDERQ